MPDPQSHPSESRDSRDSVFLQATIRSLESRENATATLRVRNISASGLMAEGLQDFHALEQIEVTLRMLGSIRGHVVWRLPNKLGIAFDQPIDPKAARVSIGGTKP